MGCRSSRYFKISVYVLGRIGKPSAAAVHMGMAANALGCRHAAMRTRRETVAGATARNCRSPGRRFAGAAGKGSSVAVGVGAGTGCLIIDRI